MKDWDGGLDGQLPVWVCQDGGGSAAAGWTQQEPQPQTWSSSLSRSAANWNIYTPQSQPAGGDADEFNLSFSWISKSRTSLHIGNM